MNELLGIAMTQEPIEFENESDEKAEHEVERAKLNQAVMYTADWTVETAVSQMRQGNIFLQPTFQRRDAWRKTNKSRLIESMLLGLPIPQVVLAEQKHERGRFVVLDGKQRLLTMLQFVGEAVGSVNNKFRLTGLEILSELEGQTFDDFDVETRREFLNYPVRSSVIRNWPDSNFLEIIFVRLNEGSVKLSPQELRQGIKPGPFTSFLEEASATSNALRTLLKLTEPDFRMRDAELLLRFLAFALYPEQYRGNMKLFLDDATVKLNSDWGTLDGAVRQTVVDIQDAIEFGMSVFGPDNFGHKWIGTSYERQLNRAVLDVQVAYFRADAVRAALRGRESEVRQEFERISENPEFSRAVESTTKSLGATNTRFLAWGSVLQAMTNGLVNPIVVG